MGQMRRMLACVMPQKPIGTFADQWLSAREGLSERGLESGKGYGTVAGQRDVEPYFERLYT